MNRIISFNILDHHKVLGIPNVIFHWMVTCVQWKLHTKLLHRFLVWVTLLWRNRVRLLRYQKLAQRLIPCIYRVQNSLRFTFFILLDPFAHCLAKDLWFEDRSDLYFRYISFLCFRKACCFNSLGYLCESRKSFPYWFSKRRELIKLIVVKLAWSLSCHFLLLKRYRLRIYINDN